MAFDLGLCSNDRDRDFVATWTCQAADHSLLSNVNSWILRKEGHWPFTCANGLELDS